jgi:hypothetical protein
MNIFTRGGASLLGEEDKAAIRAGELAVEERKLRIEQARRHSRWKEIEEVDLVSRGRGLLVSATTDEVFTVYRGTVFVPGSAIITSDQIPLRFFVRGDELVFLEATGKTWTEILEARERRRQRGRARARNS